MSTYPRPAASGTASNPAPIDPARIPIRVVELDLDTQKLTPEPRRGESVLALVRLHRRPIGVVHATAGKVPAETLSAFARQELAEEIASHLAADGVVEPRDRTCAQLRTRTLADPPSLSVIVATRERPATLGRCLDSLLALDYPDVEVVVVDNAPATSATAELVHARRDDRVEYAVEPRHGLANARNRGLSASTGELVAFTGDDAVVDRDWATALAEAFAAVPRAGCVTGLIMPAELETRPQVLLERRGAFPGGFRLAEHHVDDPAAHPFFPLAAARLGSGANMAFRARSLRALGGFDGALGTGTPARGGDDLLAFFRTAVSGHSLVYQPAAVVWRHHRREPQALSKQAFGYGVGLGAYLTATVAREPRTALSLLHRLPAGAAHALRESRRDAADPAAWPARLARLERYGLLCGPFAYAHSRWRGAARG